MNLRKSIIGVFAAVGIAVGLSAYYPGDDGFDVPTYGNGTLVNSLTVGGNAKVTTNTFSGDYVNVDTTDNCTIGRINIGGCSTNSVNPVVNIAGTYNAPSGENAHAFSDSRDVVLTSGTAANSFDCRGSASGNTNVDHFACYQADFKWNGLGTMTDFFGVYISASNGNAGSTITNGYGVYVAGVAPGLGTLTNSTGVYIRDIAANSGKEYAIHSVGTNDMSRFDGRVGIGADPTANFPLDVLGATPVGSWRSNIIARSTDLPTVRLYASTIDKWSGIGNNGDGGIWFLVNGSTITGTPNMAGGLGVNGGMVLGSPVGGASSSGTLNVATDIYKNNTAYTNPDYVFEHYFKGKIVKFAHKEGAKEYKGLKPLREVRDFVERAHTLPRIQEARDRAAKQKKSTGLFGGGDALLASVEEAYLYLFKHDARIAQLEQENLLLNKRITTLEKLIKK